MNAEIFIIIDYLTFTIKDSKLNHYDVIESILDMNPSKFEHLAKGFNFYNRSMVYNDIRILYDGIYGDSMGICVNIPGRGCASYAEETGESVISLISRISKIKDINITRIDIACDDKESYVLDLPTIWQYANDGNYRTRLLSRNSQESFKAGQGEEGAKTLYFGSKSSNYRIRIYDKAKQMGKEMHWVRFEIVLRNDYAVQAANALAESENLGLTVSGIIDDKFAFIELDNNNISRCSVASWWSEFLGEIKGVKLTSKQKFNHNIDEHKQWLQDSCGRIIAKVIAAIGQEAFNRDILEYGREKLTVSDIAMITDYKKRMGR